MVEENPERAREMAAQYHVPVFPSLDVGLRTVQGLKGVWISTPTPSHVATIEQAVAAGLAVGIEKPVADNVKDIEHCYALAAKRGVPLCCSFQVRKRQAGFLDNIRMNLQPFTPFFPTATAPQRRIDPSYVGLLKAVRSGQIGEPRAIHTVFRDHPVPSLDFLKLGGCIFHDLVVHDADYIMHVLGETPGRIYAKGSAFHPDLIKINVLDHALCVMEFASGVVATIELSRSSPYGYDQRIEVRVVGLLIV